MSSAKTRGTPVGLVGLGLMGEVYARRLVAAGLRRDRLRHRRSEKCPACGHGRPRRIARRHSARLRTDRACSLQYRSGRGGGRTRIAAGGRRQDRHLHLDLRSRPHRRTRRAGGRSLALPRSAGVRHQRAGAPGRRSRPHWRRCGDRGGCRAGARRTIPETFSYRQDRRRRPRQARHQSDPRPQPSRARRRPGVCLPPRSRSGGAARRGAGIGRGVASDGHQGAENGRREISCRKAACARRSRTRT